MGGQFAVADMWGVVITATILFVSWIMNTIQAAKKKQEQAAREERRRRQQKGGGPGAARAQQQQARRKPDRVKSEIESFLEEVTGQKQQVPPAPDRRPQQPPRRPPTLPPKPIAPQPRPVAQPASVGGGVQQHVSTYMSERISDHVEHDISDHVETHIGEDTVTDDFVKILDENTTAADVRNMLSDRAGVRKAILVNEVLQRRTFKR